MKIRQHDDGYQVGDKQKGFIKEKGMGGSHGTSDIGKDEENDDGGMVNTTGKTDTATGSEDPASEGLRKSNTSGVNVSQGQDRKGKIVGAMDEKTKEAASQDKDVNSEAGAENTETSKDEKGSPHNSTIKGKMNCEKREGKVHSDKEKKDTNSRNADEGSTTEKASAAEDAKHTGVAGNDKKKKKATKEAYENRKNAMPPDKVAGKQKEKGEGRAVKGKERVKPAHHGTKSITKAKSPPPSKKPEAQPSPHSQPPQHTPMVATVSSPYGSYPGPPHPLYGMTPQPWMPMSYYWGGGVVGTTATDPAVAGGYACFPYYQATPMMSYPYNPYLPPPVPPPPPPAAAAAAVTDPINMNREYNPTIQPSMMGMPPVPLPPSYDAAAAESYPKYSFMPTIRGGSAEPFPNKLHRMLQTCEQEGLSDVVSFLPHGRAFAVHKPRRFVEEVMPRFFKQSKLSSFQRQLNLYDFKRMKTHGPDNGAYYHELFLKGQPGLCLKIPRLKCKKSETPKCVPNEPARILRPPPNFYLYPPLSAQEKGMHGKVASPAKSPQQSNSITYPPQYGYTPPTPVPPSGTSITSPTVGISPYPFYPINPYDGHSIMPDAYAWYGYEGDPYLQQSSPASVLKQQQAQMAATAISDPSSVSKMLKPSPVQTTAVVRKEAREGTDREIKPGSKCDTEKKGEK